MPLGIVRSTSDLLLVRLYLRQFPLQLSIPSIIHTAGRMHRSKYTDAWLVRFGEVAASGIDYTQLLVIVGVVIAAVASAALAGVAIVSYVELIKPG